MNVQADVIFQIVVGLGMIAGMWRLTREVAALTARLSAVIDQQVRHEARTEAIDVRLRVLELREASRGEA